ncbi:MAG: type II toxin-antitoxin system Phd/YefM family antitoxin [Acidobacteria bacterium]|nr:type II toxin-antitoxin system Phd/YefM family antitoxin [Acidobacteriota bacterium]
MQAAVTGGGSRHRLALGDARPTCQFDPTGARDSRLRTEGNEPGACAAKRRPFLGRWLGAKRRPPRDLAVAATNDGPERLLDAAQRGPVRVTRNGRPVGIVMSMEQYERLRGAAWDALSRTMDRLSAEASRRGLTEDKLEALLSDES